MDMEMFMEMTNYKEITEKARKDLVKADVAEEVLTALKDVLAYEDDRPEAGTHGAEVYERAYKAIQNAEGER
jgi:hypothetical protein|tara:strand:- start:119 stop:334 length:216 start_codon:yes stop_codon:yes gene_type:complete